MEWGEPKIKMSGVYKSRRNSQSETHKEEVHVKTVAEIGVMSLSQRMLRTANNHQKLKDARRGSSQSL